MRRMRGNSAWLKTGGALALLAWGSGAALALELVAPLGVDEPVIPKANPLTPEKVALGQQLFFDPRLSADNTVSCASCHDPRKGFSNGERVGVGIRGQRGKRNVPTVLNAALNDFYFWDGRAASLEEQALGSIQSPDEMGQSHTATVAKLRSLKGYRAQFARAFGTEAFTIREVAAAIAAFERTLLTGNSRFDRYKFGGEAGALTAAEERGFGLFREKARCVACHLVDEFSAPFTDNRFHNLGIGIEGPTPDVGRFAVTKRLADRGKFKTPTLRNLSQTAPYMHDGRFATLEEVVDFYDKGGIRNPNFDPDITPLGLTAPGKADLVAFLRALEGVPLRVAAPPLPRE
jgi:cytochrome c peroxidase